MLHPVDHLLFVVLALLFPLRAATFGFRRLQNAAPGDVPRLRVVLYRQLMLLQWGLVAGVALLWWFQGRAWDRLGLVPRVNGGFIGVGVGLVIVIGMLVLQQRRALDDQHAWDRLRQRMRGLERMLPRTPAELRWFEAVSVTAGVCEEVLYRGYLIWYLQHRTDLLWAAVVSSILFGVAHSYQGPSGMLRTALLGGFLAAVYLLTGSLYMSMALHFLADFYSGHVMYRAYRQEAAGPPGPAPPPPGQDPVA